MTRNNSCNVLLNEGNNFRPVTAKELRYALTLKMTCFIVPFSQLSVVHVIRPSIVRRL